MDSQETTPIVETSTDVEQPTNEVELELDGEIVKVPLEELTKGYLRQSDYTKKTQALAEERKRLQEAKQEEVPDEIASARQFLDWEWVVRKQDLEKFYQQQQYEIAFNDLVKASPELKKSEKAIRDLQKATGWAFEDVIVKYWFASTDKLKKAQDSRFGIVWSSEMGWKDKPISQMTDAEYQAYRKSKGIKDKY